MKKSWTVAVLGAVVCLGVVGCTPGGEDSPSPSPSQVVTPETPEPSPTPTSKWSGDEQAAVDAVQLSNAMWNRISQNMNPAEFGDIWDVATGSSAKTAQATWTEWAKRGWYLIGDPYFIPTNVSLGPTDDDGQQFYVLGCYIITGSDLVDQEGQSQSGEDRRDRAVIQYTIIKTSEGAFLDMDSDELEGTC